MADRAATLQSSPKALETLEKLLEMPAANLELALSAACDLVAKALSADKVDAFLHDPSRDSLVALGSSNQPLSALQKKVGLDILQIANGGRVVHVFQTGTTFLTGHLEADTEELRGVKEALKIRSKLGVPLEVGGVRRGVLMVASQKADHFSAEDQRLAESIARWVALVAHRAQLVEEIARTAAEQGRRAAAEELITVLAHDLRNYLAPISLRLNLVRRRTERDGRDADARDLGLALKAVDRLGALISDLLDVARIEQGVFQVDLQPLDLGALIDEASKVLSTAEHPIVAKIPEEVVASADGARVRQCLENLISNAAKHSPHGAPITVRVSKHKNERGSWGKVDIIDEGHGIATEMLPRIFDRFVTGAQRGGGLGLGLYLAKRIATAHDGDLSVESTPGRGTRFTLLLPCHKEC
jgi:two-component system, OmpR family, sensor kinase